ncbi:MAG: RHS repeat domain-containing protein [Lachnospirales bacterium]
MAKSYSYAKDNLGKIYSDESYTLNGLNYRTRRLYNIADMNNYVQTFRSDVSYSIYTLNYSFDSKGRLYMFSSQSASEYSVGSKYDIYYTYDKNDNIKTGKTRGGVTTEYSYNDANMLTSLVNKKGTTTYSTYSYNYNLDGNINRKVESGKATDYVYDGTGRLSNEKITNGSAVTNMTYGYDNAGNRSSLTVTGTENYVTTYSYDKNNRLLKDSKKNNGASYADVTLYSYDNNGNQLRKDQSRDDLTSKPKMGLSLATFNSGYGYEKFTYNGFNQLTAFEDEAGNKATYEYYSDGLRLSKTVNGAKSSYIWTDNNLSMEIKSDEVISYAKAPGYMRTGSSKDSLYRNDKLYLFNGHGDVTSMVDKSGKVTKTYSYDAFGNEINRDKNDTNPFRYCGEYWDNETESIYLRARYYNPSIGRFTTEDPIKDESNWYAYCEGNPIAFVDFLGMYRIYYNPNTESIYDRYVAKPNNFFQGVIEIGVAFLPMGSALYEEYLRNNGMVYSSTMGYTVNDAIVDTGMYVVSSIANRLGKSVVEKGLNAYGYLVNIKNALDVITTDEVDSVVFNMFEISGIYANSSNLQYLAGVMQKSYDYVANDFTYFFCQDIIPGKTLFSIACEIMKETDAAKAEKLVQKYVTKYKCNVRTALGRDATDREVWKFEEQISNRDKFNYMLNDFRQKVLS